MLTSNGLLHEHYDAMWQQAWPAVCEGRITIDRQLRAGPDPRRGLTLLARPSRHVAGMIAAACERLHALEPEQYRQPESDLHVTVLSLFTATTRHEAEFARLADYQDAVAAALHDLRPFTVDFRGFTLSRGAVLAQGYPRDALLDAIRERLRQQLAARSLDGTVDQRYKLVTAHATAMRFAAPMRDPARFAAELEQFRNYRFGTMDVERLELVKGDWYMSADSVETLGSYSLL